VLGVAQVKVDCAWSLSTFAALSGFLYSQSIHIASQQLSSWETLSLSQSQNRMSSPTEITAGKTDLPGGDWIWQETLSGFHQTHHHLIDGVHKSLEHLTEETP